MRSMVEREADSLGMLGSAATLDLGGMQALQDTQVSQVGAAFRDLRHSQDKATLQDQPLGDCARQGSREHECPFADRD